MGHIRREIVWKLFVMERGIHLREVSWAEKTPARDDDRQEKPLTAWSCWACNRAPYCKVMRQGQEVCAPPLLQEPAEHGGELQSLPSRWSAPVVLGSLPILRSATVAWTQLSGKGPVKMEMMLCMSSPWERKLPSTIHSTSATEEFWNNLVEVHDGISTNVFIFTLTRANESFVVFLGGVVCFFFLRFGQNKYKWIHSLSSRSCTACSCSPCRLRLLKRLSLCLCPSLPCSTRVTSAWAVGRS